MSGLKQEVEKTLQELREAAGEGCELFTPAKPKCHYAFPTFSKEVVQQTCLRSKLAQKSWGDLSISDRAKHFKRLQKTVVHHMDELVDLLHLDTGKPNQEVLLHELLPALDGLKYYPKLARKALRSKKRWPHLFLHKKVTVEYVPYGVVGVIAPWNFPFFLPLNAIIQALAAGNTIVWKPSEFTTLTGAIIQTLFRLSDWPKNVIQMVTGAGTVGQALVLDPLVSKIAFTGSTRTGKSIMKLAADRLLPLSLELGGKDALLVTDGANLELASKAAVFGSFINSGQACVSTERVYVDENVADEFQRLVVEQTNALLKNASELTPMITLPQRSIVEEQIEDAANKGAKILCGGKINKNFVEPTVVTGVTKDMLLMQEETFGPLLPILPYRKLEDAICEINSSPYGLAGSVFCQDEQRAKSIASQIHSGQVMINDVATSPAIAEAPWGGVKESGLGRLNGMEGLQNFCQTRSIITNRFFNVTRLAWYPYSKSKYRWFFRAIKQLFAF